EAGRDAVVRLVDRGAQLLQSDDACQRDERDEQRVLDQILALVLTHEPSDEMLHVRTLSLTVECVRSGAHLQDGSRGLLARSPLPAGRAPLANQSGPVNVRTDVSSPNSSNSKTPHRTCYSMRFPAVASPECT